MNPDRSASLSAPAPTEQAPTSESPSSTGNLFADILGSADFGLFVFDPPTNQIVYSNPQAMEIAALVDPTDGGEQFIRMCLEREAPRCAGPLRPAPFRIGTRFIGYTLSATGSLHWIICKDVTERQRLEAIAEAMELANNIAQIFSTVRHEVGNPINAAKTALSVLLRSLDRLPPETVRDYLQRSLAELSRVEDLLRSLKSFSMYEELQLERVDLSELIRKFVGFTLGGFDQRGVTLNYLPAPEPVLAMIDPRALQQVLLNVTVNAADATDGRPEPRVTIEVTRRDWLAVIRVTDNGCGIPKEALGYLFKPFFTSKAGGTGLGLVIVKKMLAKMGGTIEVETAEGAGTTVTITLRALEAA